MIDPSSAAQRVIWELEWGLRPDEMIMPGQADTNPSNSVIQFVDFARTHFTEPLDTVRAIDVGSGLGRNAVYLAQHFDGVVGVDYSPVAVEKAKELAAQKNSTVSFVVHDALVPFHYPDNYFAVAIDSLTSTSIRGTENRRTFADNITRILTPGGLLLMRCVSTADELESALMRTNPGPDKNSSIWPQSGKFQKNFSAEEVIEMYPSLDLLQLRRQRGLAQKFGRQVIVTNWWAVFEKPRVIEEKS